MSDEKPSGGLGNYQKQYVAGAIICQQGDHAEDFYVLLGGTIGVYVNEDKVAEIDQAGAYVGELAAILKQKRNATLKAETVVQALALPVTSLERLITKSPEVGMKMLTSMAKRLSATTEKLAELEEKHAGG